MNDFGLYIIITDPVLPYTKVAEICVENEICMLQLREKHISDRELLQTAKKIRKITAGTKTSLVINDRPDIAILCNADFLHLGQDDIEYDEAKKITGKNIKTGLSTHSVQQAKDALEKNPDYIGFGPVYKTPTKAKPDPVVGTERLRQVLQFSNVPVVAIGGIFPENIDDVLKAGAKNICMVRYFMETKETEKRIKEIKSIISNYK